MAKVKHCHNDDCDFCNAPKVGSKFSDMFGEYEVIGTPVWSEEAGCYMQDVRNPDGTIVRNATEALRIYTAEASNGNR